MVKITKKESGFGLLGLIFVIAIIGVFTGGGFYFKELQQQKSLWDIGRDAEKKVQEIKVKQGGIDISSWKKYHDELNGFTVRYPNSWYTDAYGKGKSSEVRNFSEYNHGGVRPKGGLVVSLKKGCDANLDSNGFVVQTYGPFKQLEKSFCKNNFQIFFELDEQATTEDKNLLERIANTLIIDDTSTWKTYRNEKYGFEFKYPLEFSVWEDEGSVRVGIPMTRGGFSDGRYDLYFSDIQMRGNLTLDQFVHNNATYQRGNNQYQEEGNGIINSVKVYWYTLLLGSGNRKVYFFLKNDNLGIETNYNGIVRGDDNPFSEKWEQILSTFKFIPSKNSGSIK